MSAETIFFKIPATCFYPEPERRFGCVCWFGSRNRVLSAAQSVERQGVRASERRSLRTTFCEGVKRSLFATAGN